MQTADLIAWLSDDLRPSARRAADRRLGLAVGLGAIVALAVTLGWLGARPLGEAVRSVSFWMKAAYTAALALAGIALVRRLARPGAQAGSGLPAALAIFAAMAVLAAAQLLTAPPDTRTALLLGETWRVCPLNILLLAVPVYAALVWALRRMAPTRPAGSGAAAGLLAGAIAATAYGLHCTETSAAFLAIWYSLGIAASTGLGALFGARALRW